MVLKQEMQAVTGFPSAVFSWNVIRIRHCTSQLQTLLEIHENLLLYSQNKNAFTLTLFHFMSFSCLKTNESRSIEEYMFRKEKICCVSSTRREYKRYIESLVKLLHCQTLGGVKIGYINSI